MRERIEATIRATIDLHERLLEQAAAIERVGRRLADVFAGGHALYVMGNGGSAADAQHMAGELVGRFLMERRPLPCQALSTDTSVLTALANDYGPDDVFAKQVAAFAREGDAVLGISTSGNSANVLAGMKEAERLGATTIALTGRDGGELAAGADLAIIVPAAETPRIQEAHATIIHILCDMVEQILFADAGGR